ncbi:hypothetical protein G7Y89_g3007 [Cudoniella acicularis]|uniref:Clr5 domain-containing protein n=1 Tax=Cudoniella acicularis TaxID=354080 RepID=A0A8H4W6D8_9HELO|nr:hypothetical protein G7Y89_g3007 [Cudoniella acicularis]
MTKNWKDVRPEFKYLYLVDRRPLDEVRTLLKEKYGFKASVRAFKNKIEEYGWKKYKKPFSEPKSSSLASTVVASERTRLRELEEVLERQLSNSKKELASLLLTRESATQHSQDERDTDVGQASMCDENIIRVKKTIGSLEDILVHLARQINSPMGFASSWKQQPMILEDAHGTFLTIPLDVVTFDNVLETHFRFLPGTKKVAKREYTIEDSATCMEFSRACPWSTFCKPGMRIDMSMVFKDRSKTSAVCPKCNTISNEKRGVMVECKTLGCKMLFRTEEEDEPLDPVPKPGRKRARSITTSPPHGMSVKHFPLTEEEQPSLFKRVIMLINKNAPWVASKRQRTTLQTPTLHKFARDRTTNDLSASMDTRIVDWSAWDALFPSNIHNGGISFEEAGESVDSSSKNSANAFNSAGSLMGMSWGGISAANWVRDNTGIMMGDIFPFQYQSTSYHSSSYLPEPEADFMKDFACCGQMLSTLHDLLEHFEEAHLQQAYTRLSGAPIARPQSRNGAERSIDLPQPSQHAIQRENDKLHTNNSDQPNTHLENQETQELMRTEVDNPHDALDLLYKAAINSESQERKARGTQTSSSRQSLEEGSERQPRQSQSRAIFSEPDLPFVSTKVAISEWEALLDSLDGGQPNMYDRIFGGPEYQALEGDVARGPETALELSKLSGNYDLDVLDHAQPLFSAGLNSLKEEDDYLAEFIIPHDKRSLVSSSAVSNIEELDDMEMDETPEDGYSHWSAGIQAYISQHMSRSIFTASDMPSYEEFSVSFTANNSSPARHDESISRAMSRKTAN